MWTDSWFFVKVWWGHTDSAVVHYLETANEWNIGVMTSQKSDSCAGTFNILSIFYDASGEVWKVSHMLADFLSFGDDGVISGIHTTQTGYDLQGCLFTLHI